MELEDSFRVIDIKTSKSKWGDAQRLDAELQAVTYAQLAKIAWWTETDSSRVCCPHKDEITERDS